MKRILPVLLVGVMIVFGSLPAAAAAPQKIKALHSDFAACLQFSELNGASVSVEELSSLTVTPGSELRVYLMGLSGDASLFFDQEGVEIPAADISLSKLRAAGITVSKPDSNAAGVIRSVELAYSAKTAALPSAGAYVSIKFISDFSSVKDVSFEYSLTLNIGGEPQDQSSLDIAGIITPQQLDVYASDTIVSIQDGAVAVALEDIRQIQVEIGDGISIIAAMKKDERYYGVAVMDTEEITAAAGGAPVEILRTYTLHTINLNNRTNTVLIDSEITLHVYGKDGAYLGTTGDPLPYSDKYYLSNRRTYHFIP